MGIEQGNLDLGFAREPAEGQKRIAVITGATRVWASRRLDVCSWPFFSSSASQDFDVESALWNASNELVEKYGR